MGILLGPGGLPEPGGLLGTGGLLESGSFSFRVFRNIPRHIPVHLDNAVCRIEIGTGASRYDHRRDPKPLVKLPDPVDKRRDRLHVPMDHSLHQLIPDHEICRAGIFVDQKQGGSRLHGLDHVSRLGRAAAGVLRPELHRILSIGKVVDKHGNIRFLDASSVLRPDLDRRLVGDHVLSSVPGNMVVNAQLQRLQKRGLSMVAASDDQRNALPDPHPRKFSFMRKR